MYFQRLAFSSITNDRKAWKRADPGQGKDAEHRMHATDPEVSKAQKTTYVSLSIEQESDFMQIQHPSVKDCSFIWPCTKCFSV
jgi:hypothetical protein